MALLP
ncbi:hypothetical protein CGLO_10160 [Colletotrichum gloeosporioides Cg-14]